MECIFCKIANREVSANIVFENDKVMAFRDINPQAPIHIVIIPRIHIDTLNDVKDFSIYVDIFKAISEIVKKEGIDKTGYRVVANCNKDGGQTVFHLHLHLLGGRYMDWPPG